MILKRADDGAVLLTALKPCDTFLCKLLGLMFRRELAAGEGLLFIRGRESVIDTSIHMFFMRFAIATVWLDRKRRVVDKVLAQPWRPYYAARQPAMYTIEAQPGLLDQLEIGDQLTWDDNLK